MTSTPVITSTEEGFNDLIGAAEAAPPAYTGENVQEAYGQVMEAARRLSGLGYVQQQAWANKLVKGFNTTDVPLDIAYLHAEVSEAFDAWREGCSIGPELADIIIFTAGLAQMTGVDLSAEVASKLAVNTARIYAARANGTHRRVETAGGTS